MALTRSKLAISAAALAATAMTAMPLAAAELPVSAGHSAAYDQSAENMAHSRWRGRDRINGGDVVAGVLVLGAIAAIASSASNNRDRDRYREPVRSGDARYRVNSPRSNGWSSGGIDNAVDICVNQVQRGRDRVSSVDDASRDASGWRVSGSMDDGESFSCRIDNEGRIRSIDIGDGYASSGYDNSGYDRTGYANAGYGAAVSDKAGEAGYAANTQLSDEAYANARAATRYREDQGAIDQDLANSPRPAYPGGPLPGEEGYEASLGG